MRHAFLEESMCPEADRALGYAENSLLRLAITKRAGRRLLPERTSGCFPALPPRSRNTGGTHVRAEQSAEADIADAADRVRGVDPDLGRGGGEPYESPSRGDREAPLFAQLLQGIGKVFGAPVRCPDGKEEDRNPDEQAPAHGATSGATPCGSVVVSAS